MQGQTAQDFFTFNKGALWTHPTHWKVEPIKTVAAEEKSWQQWRNKGPLGDGEPKRLVVRLMTKERKHDRGLGTIHEYNL